MNRSKSMMKITINIQEELNAKLKQFVPPRKISQFIAESIEKELDAKERTLIQAYQEAYNDPVRTNDADEWDILNADPAEKPSTNRVNIL